MESRIMLAWEAWQAGEAAGTAVFEHDQWWIQTADGRTFSVCDATGPGSVDGFSFEAV